LFRPLLMADFDEGGTATAETNVLAVVSAIAGGLAFLSSGCCCVPILSIVSMLVLPVLSLVGIGTGIAGLGQAKVSGQGKGLAMVGIGLSAGAILMAVAAMSLSVVAGATSAILQRMGQ
jgi:hypothetical protein